MPVQDLRLKKSTVTLIFCARGSPELPGKQSPLPARRLGETKWRERRERWATLPTSQISPALHPSLPRHMNNPSWMFPPVKMPDDHSLSKVDVQQKCPAADPGNPPHHEREKKLFLCETMKIWGGWLCSHKYQKQTTSTKAGN